jgi:hypothetical protein
MDTPDNKPHTGPKLTREEEKRIRAVITQLSTRLDLIGLREQIIDKSKMGKKPHPSDPWGYTREILAYYTEGKTDPQEVIRLFESVGCHNDIEAARFILRHDTLIP